MVKVRHVPHRRCVSCGQVVAKRELSRIVRTPEGAVMLDLTGKSLGRGAYLCGDQACWQRSITKGRLDHALRHTLQPGDRQALLGYYDEKFKPAGIGDVT